MSETYLSFYFEPKKTSLALDLHRLLSALESVVEEVNKGVKADRARTTKERQEYADAAEAIISTAAAKHAETKSTAELAKHILGMYLDAYKKEQTYRLMPDIFDHEYDKENHIVQVDDDGGDPDVCRTVLREFLLHGGGSETICIRHDVSGVIADVIYSDGTVETFDAVEMANIEAGAANDLGRGASDESREEFATRLLSEASVEEKEGLLLNLLKLAYSADLHEAMEKSCKRLLPVKESNEEMAPPAP